MGKWVLCVERLKRLNKSSDTILSKFVFLANIEIAITAARVME